MRPVFLLVMGLAAPVQAGEGADLRAALSQAEESVLRSVEAARALAAIPPATLRGSGIRFRSSLEEDPAFQQLLERDFAVLSSWQGDGASPLHERIFPHEEGNRHLGPDHVRYFLGRVRSIEIGRCADGANACVANGSDRMQLAQAHLNLPQLARIGTMLHESRHVGEMPSLQHTPCGARAYDGSSLENVQGRDACDRDSRGAYGLEAVMMRNIERRCATGTCTDLVKTAAGLYAAAVLRRVQDPSEILADEP